MNTERIKIMETEEEIIERLIIQGSSDEELFNKYPEYVGHITRYREFLIEELTIKAEGLQEAIGEGGTEVFSEEQLAHMRADMEQAYARASKYNKILKSNL